jgi:oligopeptidase A
MTDSISTLENPLLAASGLPPFDRIEPQHVVPAVRQRLAEAAVRFAEIEKSIRPDWASTIEALDELDRPFDYCWRPVSHLFGVRNSPELREAYETVLPEIVAFGLKVRQSQPIYQALKSLRDGSAWSALDGAQQRIIERRLLDAELAGIGLPDDERETFNKIAEELSQLATSFSNNVLDATKAFSLVLDKPADVEGLPPSLLRLAASSYNGHKAAEAPEATAETGPWRFTLDAPSFGPFMEH